MDPSQRENVWRALKEDGDKLIAESSNLQDRDSRRLQEAMTECQHIFQKLSTEAAAKGR